MDDPPAPPTRSGVPSEDDTPRVTAATWVAGTGALLLIIAAAIFLAVSWDVLGITARVAVVGSVTGAAIVGGHLLRRLVPAVGAVVYHLGALLLPVDAVGLGLQLDLSTAAIWSLAGLVTLGALPLLAVAARSRVLAATSIVGVPVLATGLGLAELIHPAVAVAGGGLLSLGTLALRGTRVVRVWWTAPTALGIVAVTFPLVAIVLDLSVAEGQIVAHIRAAGWSPGSWVPPVGVGAMAMVGVAVLATRRRSQPMALLVPVLGAVSGLVAVLPGDTPRLAVLLAFPVVALVLEVVALVGRDDQIWSRPLGWAAAGVEIVGAWAVVPVIAVVIAPGVVVGAEPDAELATALAVAAIAWTVAASRRMAGPRNSDVLGPMLVTAGVLFGAAAIAVLLAGDHAPLAAVVLMATAAAALLRAPVYRDALASHANGVGPTTEGPPAGDRAGRGARRGDVGGRDVRGRGVAANAALSMVLMLVGAMAAWSTEVALPLTVVTALVTGLHVRGLLQEVSVATVSTAAVALPAGVVATILLATTSPVHLESVSGPLWLDAQGLQAMVAMLSLLALAATVDLVRPVADLIRGIGAGIAVLAVATAGLPAAFLAQAQDATQVAALSVLRPVPSLLPLLILGTVWLVIDAVRRRSRVVATIAAPVAVRLVAVAVVAAGGSPMQLGLVLLGLALVATGVALVGGREVRAPAGLVAALSAVPGWALIAATPEIRAWVVVGVGVLLVTAGVVRRRAVVGHLGGVVTTGGVWLLFGIHDVTAVDVWLLPVAAQLAVLGRGGRISPAPSSWITDVPPLLLVAVPAIGERLADGPGWHSVLAGGLALAAIIAGGSTGRGGPLVAGIATLVAVVGVETVAFAALVPTWAWFALAGAVLIGAAILIERHGMSASGAVGRLRDLAGDNPREARGRRNASSRSPQTRRG